MVIIGRDGIAAMFSSIQGLGYTPVGPVARGGAIVLDILHTAGDLASGVRAEQGPGRYRLTKTPDRALLAQANGPHSWKQFLFPPSLRLFSARKNGRGLEIQTGTEPAPVRYAFFGVRPCDLHAIAIQDRVFLGGEYNDAAYNAVREQALIVALNCSEAAATCFCVSMGTGPQATGGYDLALTEVVDEARHEFLVETGTDKGRRVLDGVPHRPAGEADIERARAIVARTAQAMGRRLDTTKIDELLTANADHPRWDVTGGRCLTCANCTMVCPTCFCTSAEDVTDLSGERAERWRRWDSCFTSEFSYIHGGSIRASARSRYRQWMTHKLATWHDQFGTSGCVGCGRCITWCPVGIDITEEAQAIRATSGGRRPPITNEEKQHGNP